MLDVLIKNARIVDGTGSPWYFGDIAVQGQSIVGLGRVDSLAVRLIDAGGMVVAPGFIDAHSHSDMALLKSPLAESKIRQGVTTEVIGQCGSSAAPRGPHERDEYTFSTVAEYLTLLENTGTSVNVVPLVGHGTLRQMVMGHVDRAATSVEIAEMSRLISTALDEGAHGFTTGLIYPPGSYATNFEIIALARVVATKGGIYATHMRDEGARLLESIRESIEVAEKAQIPLHISHHKVCGEANWGLVRESLKVIDAKREQGLDITLDQYPYTATSTGLKVVIPAWAHEGGVEGLTERLSDAATRQTIRGQIGEREQRWDLIMVDGISIHERAVKQGQEPVDVSLDLLLADKFDTSMVRFAMCEGDVEYVLKHPAVMVGSDASGRAIYGPLSVGTPHPRAYGTFPRVLGTYVRERKVLTLEEAVRKMTGFPAARFQLWNRGLLRPGMRADLVMFDPAEIADVATYARPHAYPRGVALVMVNGRVVVETGEHLGLLAGQVLRKGEHNSQS
ncbi:MAG: D-aminoacylase [Peptococcaceae bacterium]|nr:D-aminoacylase [Peptococcaceae bacterium]